MKKRILCRICLIVIGVILLLYFADRERFFPVLRISVFERQFQEGDPITVSGQVYKKIKKKESVVLYLKEVRVQNAPSVEAGTERLLVYQKRSNGSKSRFPKIGQQILVTGTVGFFRESPNPGNFNQKFYYQKQKIHAAVWDGEVLRVMGRISLREKLWQIRMRASDRIIGTMGEKRGGILCAMLLGETAYTDEEVKELYQKSGIGHLLAISGLHVSFLGIGIYEFFRKTGASIRMSALAGVGMLGVYVVMTGGSVSAIRAFTMFLVRMGAKWSGREYDGLTALSLAALVVLLFNPLRLLDAGFLLSFGAVLGVYGVKDFRPSLSVQLVVLPVLFYYYYEINCYSPVWNLVAIPLASVVLGTGLMGAIAGYLPGMAGNMISRAFLAPAGVVLWMYEVGSRLIMKLPRARWVAGRPDWWQIFLYYLLMAICIWMPIRQKKRGKKRIFQVLVASCALAVFLCPKVKKDEMEIFMLDVDQGDCFFIRGPDGGTHLIDGGSSTQSQVGKYRIESFLKSQGVGKLDYVWVSHGDGDHINGIWEMIKRMDVGVRIRHLVLPPRIYWNAELQELAADAMEAGIPVMILEKGQQFREKEMNLTCLWPKTESAENEAGNEASMVLSLSYGEFDMLFTGDLEKGGEEQVAGILKEGQEKGVLPSSYEILKLGHHGSRNSTGEEFLKVVQPSFAFCSSGRENQYGHPHEETLERLAKWGVSLYNTKDRSAVKVCTDGKKYCIVIP